MKTPDQRLDELWNILRDDAKAERERIGEALTVLRSTKTDSIWIAVESFKDVPKGSWLFKTEEERSGNTVHTGTNFGNGCVIGGHFAYDMPRVIAYAPIPE
jgi:hypothetical protein